MVKILTFLNAALFVASVAILILLLTGKINTTAADTPIIYRPMLPTVISIAYQAYKRM